MRIGCWRVVISQMALKSRTNNLIIIKGLQKEQLMIVMNETKSPILRKLTSHPNQPNMVRNAMKFLHLEKIKKIHKPHPPLEHCLLK